MRQYETRVPMTETQTIEALLRRWAELEPDRCRCFGADRKMFVLVRNVWQGLATPDFCMHDASTQAATQEAIEARGWRTTLEYYLDPIDELWKWRATVREPENDAYDQKAAAALLSAYLQALEARRP